MSQNNPLMSWKTDPPIICPLIEPAYSVAQRMAKQKNNCALVRDSVRNKIVGIFTAKDLAFKVVASGLHPKLLKAKDLMTPNPIFARTTEPASKALNTMIKYKIRHLPLLNEEDEVVGLLDITKCFNQTLARLRKLNESSKKLSEALNEVQENIASMDHDDENVEKHSQMYYEAQDMVIRAKNNINSLYQNNLGFSGTGEDFVDFESLLRVMETPTLHDVLNTANYPTPLFLDANNTIRSAADLMKKHNTTAVLVRDTATSNKSVIGILTTKDIVYRVLAKDNEPDFTTINRIMTHSPKFGPDSMGIVEALEMMYEGHFLNLPVINEMHNVVGMVSVLQLTNMALSQLQQGMSGGEDEWDRFWSLENGGSGGPGSFTGTGINGFEDSYTDVASNYSHSHSAVGPLIRSPTQSSISIHNANLKKKMLKKNYKTPPLITNSASFEPDFETQSLQSSEFSESNSLYMPPESEIGSYVSYASEAKRNGASHLEGGIRPSKQSFSFKIKNLDSNRVHKVTMVLPKSKNLLDHLQTAIRQKLDITTETITLSYQDEDEDLIEIINEDDLKTAIEIGDEMRKGTGSAVTTLFVKAVVQKRTEPKQLEAPKGPETSPLIELLSKPEIVVSGVLFTLSLGILLGITLNKQR